MNRCAQACRFFCALWPRHQCVWCWTVNLKQPSIPGSGATFKSGMSGKALCQSAAASAARRVKHRTNSCPSLSFEKAQSGGNPAGGSPPLMVVPVALWVHKTSDLERNTGPLQRGHGRRVQYPRPRQRSCAPPSRNPSAPGFEPMASAGDRRSSRPPRPSTPQAAQHPVLLPSRRR